MKLEDIRQGIHISGLLPNQSARVVNVEWHGSEVLTIVFRRLDGSIADQILYRSDETNLSPAAEARPWRFDADGNDFRLVAEAHRIRLAHLFDPVLAVHTSLVEPLPHQITAVYEAMLPKHPLRFVLADDPGAGKTIMAGLLIKELMARGDVKRCLIVCPGSLVEQWQDELNRKFQLPFEILTNDKLESARTGNWFLENHLAIARLDKLSRDEDVQAKLSAPDCRFDLIICDEAHKLAATFFGGEIKYTKRYQLGQLLSGLTRHFLLMTATPHNGKDEDFQLFLALIDPDQFEGRFREGVHQIDTTHLMRRMVKETLRRFDGAFLFPKRIAYTQSYQLSPLEGELYREVTDYVRNEFNRADDLSGQRRGTVGFALTVLQRRLASSPEAIYQSLKRRRERLEQRALDLQRGSALLNQAAETIDFEDLDDSSESEFEAVELEVLDQATTANTLAELEVEIESLRRLERLAGEVRRSDQDSKWRELSQLLQTSIFSFTEASGVAAPGVAYDAGAIEKPIPSAHQKLVIFTEHRDTLNYLHRKIATLFGKESAIEVIHGGIAREGRRLAQASFLNDPNIRVLLATDAAGEGINLQRAHLMVNYDLPWNPNRLEQRFGRIHRIGQKETCHLWNLVAGDTREGEVYQRLLEKLEESRAALGGQVFDVLGQLNFDGKPLRELLIEAIRYGDQPEVRARLTQAVAGGVDQEHLRNLINNNALAHDVMNLERVQELRADMERAQAKRLQPHYIAEFFLEAFKRLGGSARAREQQRFEITQVPAVIRNFEERMGRADPILQRYERIAFEKSAIEPSGQVLAEFICPGHPLLDATLGLTLSRNKGLLTRGTILVDERDPSQQVRVLFCLEHTIQDDSRTDNGERRTISKRLLYVEHAADGQMRHLHYAPYLDYRALSADDPSVTELLALPEFRWIAAGQDELAQRHAIEFVVPQHIEEVRTQRMHWIERTRAAVQSRLNQEILYWDGRAEREKQRERASEPGARLNSTEFRKRADDLEFRRNRRMTELDREAQISALPPVVVGGLVVLPFGLLAKLKGLTDALASANTCKDNQAAAAAARAAVMQVERTLGNQPKDVEFDKLGYDIESKGQDGRLRFIEVKGRIADADHITVTKNEILYSFNHPEHFILAIVEFLPLDQQRVSYARNPFQGFGLTHDFNGASVNFKMTDLLARAQAPN